jgi:CubicO group peptidase (beta-lactamase class C family)
LTLCGLLALAACAAPTAVSTTLPSPEALAAQMKAAHIDPAIFSAPPAASRITDAKDSNMLFWDQAVMDERFRTMEARYNGTIVKAGGTVHALDAGKPLAISDDEIAAFMEDQRMAGLVLIRDGKVRLEKYARGNSAESRYTSFSMAKSFTGLLVGAAIKDGLIGSLDDQLTKYLPELKGSAYDGVTLGQAMTMTSGVKWNENYGDPDADVSAMFRNPPPAGEDSTIAYMRRLPRAHPPGTKYNYSTGESALVGVLVKRATGKPLAQYLSEKVWAPYGMESDAFWMVDWSLNEMGGCCISARLRDYARFGMFVMDGAKGALIEDYAKLMVSPIVPLGEEASYGLKWWVWPKGRYGAMGNFGQFIIVDPATKTVIAVNSALGPAERSKERGARFVAFLEKLMALGAK